MENPIKSPFVDDFSSCKPLSLGIFSATFEQTGGCKSSQGCPQKLDRMLLPEEIFIDNTI
jgi:hypothetical protein